MSRRAVVAAVGVAGALVLLALATTSGGPLLRPPEPDVALPGPAEPPAMAPTAAPMDDGDADQLVVDVDVRILVWVLVVVLVAILVRLMLKNRGRDGGIEAVEEVDTLGLLEEATDETARDRVRGIGDPRNAVVAAWVEIERAVAASGVQRRPSETSTELVVRVVTELGLDTGPLSDLGERYRAARFSEHALGPADVERALALLETVHAQLTAPGRRPDRSTRVGGVS